MNAKLKKPVLFAVIVIIGSILVLSDIPLILLLPIILIVVFVALLALGSLTIAEVRGALRFEAMRKIGILKRLDEMKFFEKGTAETKKALLPPVKKEIKKEEKGETKPGIFSHISTLISSVGSLGSVLKQRSAGGKKVDDINKLLDKTVSEKVSAPPPAERKPAAAAGPAPGGGGGMPKTPGGEDPFISLSGDEFDEGLLEGLGDDLAMTPAAVPEMKPPSAGSGPAAAAPGPDLPPPTLEISAAAGDILREAGEGGGLEEFSGLEAGDLSDTDFGDLDNLNLDEAGLDAELGEGPDMTAAAPAPVPDAPDAPPAAAPPAAPTAAESGAVKTAWIPSDAPKDAVAEDEISTQADMAAFASGPGGDEDLLSSIASDVKRATKEQDLSLLRELKDFRAPASEIQQELGGMYERMNQAQPARKKKPPAPEGKK